MTKGYKKHVKGNLCGIFSLWAKKRNKNVKSTKATDGFTMKTFPKWLPTLMEGMEQRLYFVTSLLSWTLLRFCVREFFAGKVLGLNTNLILLGKWWRSSPTVQRALFACFLSICQFATFHSEVKNCRYGVFLEYKIERGFPKTRYYFVRSCLR